MVFEQQTPQTAVACVHLKLTDGQGLQSCTTCIVCIFSSWKKFPLFVIFHAVIDERCFLCYAVSYYLSFEYAAHDLGGLLKDDDIVLSTVHISCLFCQLLKALTFCHVKNIVHCDIRPCNIFVSAKYASDLHFALLYVNFFHSHMTVLTTFDYWYMWTGYCWWNFCSHSHHSHESSWELIVGFWVYTAFCLLFVSLRFVEANYILFVWYNLPTMNSWMI